MSSRLTALPAAAGEANLGVASKDSSKVADAWSSVAGLAILETSPPAAKLPVESLTAPLSEMERQLIRLIARNVVRGYLAEALTDE